RTKRMNAFLLINNTSRGEKSRPRNLPLAELPRPRKPPCEGRARKGGPHRPTITALVSHGQATSGARKMCPERYGLLEFKSLIPSFFPPPKPSACGCPPARANLRARRWSKHARL